LGSENFRGFEALLGPDAVNKIHSEPFACHITEISIEDVCFDELGMLVAEGYGVADAEDGRQTIIRAADIFFGIAYKCESGVNAFLGDNLRRHLHIKGGETELPAFSSAGDYFAYEAIGPAEKKGGIGDVTRLEHITDGGA